MGVKSLNQALENLQAFQHCITHSPHDHELASKSREFQVMSIRNAHLALGYLLASQKMRQTGYITTLKDLLLEEAPLMKSLISVEKRIKRRREISPQATEKYVLKVQTEYNKS